MLLAEAEPDKVATIPTVVVESGAGDGGHAHFLCEEATEGHVIVEPEPSDALFRRSASSTRLKTWLNTRLRQLASAQRIQDARALRSEFALD